MFVPKQVWLNAALIVEEAMKMVGVILAAVFCWPTLIWPPIIVGYMLFSK